MDADSSRRVPIETPRVALGIPSVDALLGGGLETDAVTEFYGEGGSGKTVACLQVATRLAAAGTWVAYIDTEGVSVDRLDAISGGQLPQVLGHLLLSTPHSMTEQTRAVHSACALAKRGSRRVGLIVVDSVTFYYRLSIGQEEDDSGRTELAQQLAELVGTALSSGVPVVVTNQVWRNLKDGVLEPLGGSYVNHVAKTILRFERLDGGRRRVVLVKHRALPPGSAEFQITATGTR